MLPINDDADQHEFNLNSSISSYQSSHFVNQGGFDNNFFNSLNSLRDLQSEAEVEFSLLTSGEEGNKISFPGQTQKLTDLIDLVGECDQRPRRKRQKKEHKRNNSSHNLQQEKKQKQQQSLLQQKAFLNDPYLRKNHDIPNDSFELLKKITEKHKNDYKQKYAQQQQQDDEVTFKKASQFKGFQYQQNAINSNDNQLCQYCGIEVNRKELQNHQYACQANEERNYDAIHCPYCGDSIIREFTADHFQDCIAYFEDQFEQMENIIECSICMNEITTQITKLTCNHSFHQKCLNDWLAKKNECPVCRRQL